MLEKCREEDMEEGGEGKGRRLEGIQQQLTLVLWQSWKASMYFFAMPMDGALQIKGDMNVTLIYNLIVAKPMNGDALYGSIPIMYNINGRMINCTKNQLN